MKVERLELVPYALPFRKPYVTSRGSLDKREIVLVRLHCDDGSVGLGEAVPLSLRGGVPTGAVLADLERCRPSIEGCEANAEALTALYSHCVRALEHAPSLAGIDSALLDLSGKRDGVPVWKLLGAETAEPVRCNATLVAGAPAAVAADARAWEQDGFGTFKLKVGDGQDVAQVAAVRRALPGKAIIRIDANGAWDPPGAIDKLRAMAQYRVQLAEQPVPTLEELALVRRESDVPIVADESIADRDEAAEAARLSACDAVTVKLSKVGGSAEARAIAELLPTYVSSALDGPVGIAAAAHLAQVIPDTGLAHGLATQRLFAVWPAKLAAQLDGPMLTPANAPGLGVEIDEQALAALRIDVE